MSRGYMSKYATKGEVTYKYVCNHKKGFLRLHLQLKGMFSTSRSGTEEKVSYA